MTNPAWYLAAILLLLAALMGFNLLSLWLSVSLCFDYAQKVIDPSVLVTGAEGIAGYCDELNNKLNEAVDKYLAVLLSLIGGAAVSGGYASAVTPIPPNRKDEDQ